MTGDRGVGPYCCLLVVLLLLLYCLTVCRYGTGTVIHVVIVVGYVRAGGVPVPCSRQYLLLVVASKVRWYKEYGSNFITVYLCI